MTYQPKPLLLTATYAELGISAKMLCATCVPAVAVGLEVAVLGGPA
jgi:hypothetical protein